MLKVLHVVQGATGGIGRVESLLDEVWARNDRLDVSTVRRDFAQINLPPGMRKRKGAARFAWMLAVVHALGRARPDVVILSHLNLAPFAAISRALHPRARVVAWVYGAEAWSRPGLPARIGLRLVDQVWSISEHTARVFSAESGFPRDRIVVVPLALEPRLSSALACSSTQSAGNSPPEILTVSRLWRGYPKGIDHLLVAMAGIPGSVRLTIVGEGDDRPRLERIARENGIGSRVTFTGAIDDADLTERYGRCSIFVLPSEREGFGLVCLEAMAAGKPVIAARAGALPELVRENETGLLVPFGDRAALAAAINALLADPAAANRLGHSGRSREQRDFSFARFADQVGELLFDPGNRAPLPANQTG